ncbi:MAG: single-stranded DNA-binding protein [Anaerolineae bacterium]|nr:single-stranded DNA-binding protein [Anaerolineae bacterium]
MSVNNDCRFIGNLTHPPHFQRVGVSKTPFMRLYLAVDDERDPTSFVRVVVYGETALLAHAYLDPGSKVLIQARYRQRKRQDCQETVHEFVADQIVFIDKINWERGDATRALVLGERGNNGAG